MTLIVVVHIWGECTHDRNTTINVYIFIVFIWIGGGVPKQPQHDQKCVYFDSFCLDLGVIAKTTAEAAPHIV